MNTKLLLLRLLVLSFCCVFAPIGADAQTTNIRIAFNGFGGTAPMYLEHNADIFKKHNLKLVDLEYIP